jgi:hypothetical protein
LGALRRCNFADDVLALSSADFASRFGVVAMIELAQLAGSVMRPTGVAARRMQKSIGLAIWPPHSR